MLLSEKYNKNDLIKEYKKYPDFVLISNLFDQERYEIIK